MSPLTFFFFLLSPIGNQISALPCWIIFTSLSITLQWEGSGSGRAVQSVMAWSERRFWYQKALGRHILWSVICDKNDGRILRMALLSGEFHTQSSRWKQAWEQGGLFDVATERAVGGDPGGEVPNVPNDPRRHGHHHVWDVSIVEERAGLQGCQNTAKDIDCIIREFHLKLRAKIMEESSSLIINYCAIFVYGIE